MTSNAFARLNAAVDIHSALNHPTQADYSELVERDRAIGAGITTSDPADRVWAWWRSLDTTPQPKRLQQVLELMALGFSLAGLICGASVAGAALAYRGDYPINLLTLFALLLLLPWAAFAAGVLFRLIYRWRSLSSGTAGAVRSLVITGVERFAEIELQYRLGQSQTLSDVTHAMVSRILYGFAVTFYVATIGVLLAYVAFSDLAFGWSSTLQIESASIEGWVRAVSLPWSGWLPSAVPSQELIEQSQFARIGVQTYDASKLGAWWPFVLMTLIAWGLAPRLVLWGIAVLTLRRSVDAFLLDHPLVSALLDRLAQPELEYRTDARPHHPEAITAAANTTGQTLTPGLIISWNGASQVPEVDQVYNATLAEPLRERLRSLSPTRLHVHVKSWEPPVLELNDLLLDARQLAPDGTIITVVLEPLDGAIDQQDVGVWQHALARLGDAHIYAQPAVEAR
ncbi:MAG: DUF2868 domain-containing protein [Pseudomonadota bacterium]